VNRENPDDAPRSWMGIDITHLAINLIKHRLARFDPAPKFRVEGEPEDLEGARELAARDRYQFQYWALGLIGARPAASDRKKGADKGIDGSFNFIDDASGKARSVLVQVKSGKVQVGDIRDLKGVLDTHRAEMGVFITLEPPTKPMIQAAVGSGHYHSESWGKDYPRIQILTIEELLADPDRPHPRCLRTPPRVLGETFKEAPKHRDQNGKQLVIGG
jgi:site-specific DNA-methyltransferase (adenine-specific)